MFFSASFDMMMRSKEAPEDVSACTEGRVPERASDVPGRNPRTAKRTRNVPGKNHDGMQKTPDETLDMLAPCRFGWRRRAHKEDEPCPCSTQECCSLT